MSVLSLLEIIFYFLAIYENNLKPLNCKRYFAAEIIFKRINVQSEKKKVM